MKRVFALLVCFTLAVCVLTACDGTVNGNDELHIHTYAAEWSSDSASHWYEPTCECTDSPITRLSHVDDNKDGACDICKFTDHTHTYSEEWTADCTNHWNAADCNHIVAGANVAPHADDNGDGRCDVCGYVIEDLHTHIYDGKYTVDSGYHWYAPICEHADAEVVKEAHNVNAAGLCTVCDARVKDIDRSDIAAVLNAAVASNGKVTGGNVIFNELVYGQLLDEDDNYVKDENGDYVLVVESGKRNDVYFVLGNGESYIFYKSFDANGVFGGGEHQWYQQMSEDEVFAVMMPENSYKLEAAAGDPQFLNGFTYTPGSLLAAADNTETLSITVLELYNLMSNSNTSDTKLSYDPETGAYAFSYTYFTVNTTEGKDDAGNAVVSYDVQLFNVTVDFTVDDNFVIDDAYIYVESYRNLEGVDNDITYDPETNTVKFNALANPTVYEYDVYQTSGVRTFTSPYPKESLIPRDFELYSCETYLTEDTPPVRVVTSSEHITDSTTLAQYKSAFFYLMELDPVTSYTTMVNEADISVTFVNNDPDSDGSLWSDAGWYYSTFDGYIGFYTKDAGSYTVTVTYKDVVKTFTVEVKAPDQGDIEVSDNQIVVTTTDTYVYDDKYDFVAPADGTYTFVFPAGLGYQSAEAYEKNKDPEINVFDPDVNSEEPHSITVELKAGEVFEIHYGATTKGTTFVITYTYVPASDDE